MYQQKDAGDPIWIEPETVIAEYTAKSESGKYLYSEEAIRAKYHLACSTFNRFLIRHNVPFRYPRRKRPGSLPFAPILPPLGEFMKARLMTLNITVDELSKKSGLSTIHLRRIAQGKRGTTESSFTKIAAILQLSDAQIAYYANQIKGGLPKNHKVDESHQQVQILQKGLDSETPKLDPRATIDGFFDGLDKVMAEVKQLRKEKADWENKAVKWAGKIIELQEILAKSEK